MLQTLKIIREFWNNSMSVNLKIYYEMDIFLEKHNLTKTNSKRHLETLNSVITIKEINSVIKNFPTKQTPGLDDFTGKFYQIFMEEIKSLLY